MRYLPWQCESEGALCNCVPLVEILRWFLRWSPKMPGGNQESSKYHDASYSNSSVWRFPNFCDGCFCFSWLPLIFNNVFKNSHTQKDGWKILWWNAVFMFGWTDPGYKEIPKDPEKNPTVPRSFEGATFVQKTHGWCWVCFQVDCGLTDKTTKHSLHSKHSTYAWLRHIRLYLSTPGGGNPIGFVMGRSWESFGGWISLWCSLPLGSFKWHV